MFEHNLMTFAGLRLCVWVCVWQDIQVAITHCNMSFNDTALFSSKTCTSMGYV